jgi:hypothetical protein
VIYYAWEEAFINIKQMQADGRAAARHVRS